MSDLDHQELAKLLNKRRENHLMAEMEERSTPFFWMVMIAIAAITLWSVT